MQNISKYGIYYLFRTTGYVTLKVGKTAALALGGGIILLQIAQQKGYITIDWNKVRQKAESKTGSVESKLGNQTSKWMQNVNIVFKNPSFVKYIFFILDQGICSLQFLLCCRICRWIFDWIGILVCRSQIVIMVYCITYSICFSFIQRTFILKLI